MPTEKQQIAVVATALSEDLRAVPALARPAGFAGILFDAFAPRLDLTSLSPSGRREFKHMLSAQDQQLVGLRADVGAKGFVPGSDVDRLIAQIDRVMETAASLGSPLVCLDVGPLPSPAEPPRPKRTIPPEEAGLIIIPTLAAAPAPETASHPAPAEIDPVFVAQVDAVMMELGWHADRYGTALALRSDLASYAALARVLKVANCPWFGIDLDPVAVLRDDWDMDEVFSHAGSLIRHVRARDALRGAEHRTKPAPIGQGNTDWGALLADLDGAGYHGWITLDTIELPNRAAAAAAGAKAIRSLMR